MGKRKWIKQRAVAIAATMPDMFPVGYARYLAEQEWIEAHA